MDGDLDGYSDDVLVLREAIDNQNKLLHKLCEELDEEREAASTAASEAMSMILRLQIEKAAVAMEARHYRRMSEEKMQYAQESLDMFEQLMYRKEMEIASLEFQVQAYRHKLLSLGLDDFDVGRMQRSPQAARSWQQTQKISRSMWVDEGDEGEEGEDEVDEDGPWSNMAKLKRNPCAPALRLTASASSFSSSYADHQGGKYSGNTCSSKNNRLSHPWSSFRNLSIKEEGEDDEVVEVHCEDDVEEEQKFGNETDGLVVESYKMNSDSNPVNFNSVPRFTSFHSAVGDDEDIENGSRCSFTSCRSADAEDLSEFDVHFSCPCLETGADKKINELHGGVYDVFEVPHDRAEDGKFCEILTDEVIMDHDDRLWKLNSPPQHKPNSTPEEKAKLIKELYCSQAELNMRLTQLEDESERMKQERNERTMEEFKLLKDINKRLETLQSQVESPNCEEQSPQIRREKSCISSIIEAILHFSI